jgi:DNA polymerase III subunit delta'
MGFDTFLGNAKALAAVQKMLGGGRVPGALLFTGPDGVGKKTLALMLAKALVCEKGPVDFCGQCANCRKADAMLAASQEDLARRHKIKESARRVEGLIYFDLQLIAPLTRYILTEQVRQLRNLAYTRPFELPRRIFILDEAHAVHWQAVDLLLKVLEEPPDTCTIILVCPNAHELRPTIRSRCVRISFQPVEESLILELLAKNKDLTDSQKKLAARVAAGSVARTKAFDPAEYERLRQPWLGFLEVVARRASRTAGAPDWRLLFDSTRALAENRDDFETTLHIGYSLLRDLLQVLLQGQEKEVVNIDLLPRLKEWAPKLRLRSIEKLKAGLDQSHRLMIRNVNQQLGFETLGIEILTESQAGAP